MPRPDESSDRPPAQPTQLTRPKKGEPVEIPVPKRKDVLAALEKAAKRVAPQSEKR